MLAAHATSLPEVGGDAAAYFDPADPGALYRELGSLLADGERRNFISRRGFQWCTQFSWERTASQTAAIYLELL